MEEEEEEGEEVEEEEVEEEEEEASKSRHSTKIQTGEPTKSNPEEVSSDLVTRNWLCFVLFCLVKQETYYVSFAIPSVR